MSLEGDGHAVHLEVLVAFDDDAILMALTRAGTAVALAGNGNAIDLELSGGSLDDLPTMIGGVTQADDLAHIGFQEEAC